MRSSGPLSGTEQPPENADSKQQLIMGREFHEEAVRKAVKVGVDFRGGTTATSSPRTWYSRAILETYKARCTLCIWYRPLGIGTMPVGGSRQKPTQQLGRHKCHTKTANPCSSHNKTQFLHTKPNGVRLKNASHVCKLQRMQTLPVHVSYNRIPISHTHDPNTCSSCTMR